MVQLRALEEAARALEEDDGAERVDEWLKILLAPGGSLGGARPKASVAGVDGSLWIAKFPSRRDEIDVGAWEMVLQVLARGCEIDVPEARADAFFSNYRTYLVKRFDRRPDGGRIHFASAMTLTGHMDGDDASTGASYLELARVLIAGGADPKTDLAQLWRRIVFNICTSNADDHLRNHGFLLEPGKGWRLAPAYDVNPFPDAHGLKLNVNAVDNALDMNLALSVAPEFRISPKEAKAAVKQITSTVKRWRKIANGLKIARAEQERMAPAFRVAENF
jgi:serine/threonine-protein kinase HipA